MIKVFYLNMSPILLKGLDHKKTDIRPKNRYAISDNIRIRLFSVEILTTRNMAVNIVDMYFII